MGTRPKARTDEIKRWLRYRLTSEAAIAEVQIEEDHIRQHAIPVPLWFKFLWILMGGLLIDLYYQIVDGPRRSGAELIAEWIRSHDTETVEIWKYDTGGDSWERLHGECGFAIVQDEEVVDFWMWFEN